jgi:hypothetical protein
MFGAIGCTPEDDTMLFADGNPDGTVQFIEWQTPAPFMLGSVAVHAFHEAADDTQRAFRHLTIEARQTGGTFTTIYDSAIAVPYGDGAEGRELQRCINVRPIHAQEFRAEFVQDGSGALSGSRVQELDGLLYDPIFSDAFEPH